ncbi:MAG: DUF5317 family protein [Candidatus Limnocylindrales bacterium]
MFILYAIAGGLLLGTALGGRWTALGSITIRWAPLIVVGFLSQIVLFSDAVASRVGSAGPALYVGSTLMVGAAVVRNLRIPGVPLIVLGALSNMAAILANGGFMPAAPGALASLGKSAPTIYSNSAVVARPALELLTDQFALPRWLPFANVFSVGDLLIGAGIIVLIVATMGRGRLASGQGEPVG